MASLPRTTPKSQPPQLKAQARREERSGRVPRAIELLEEVLRQTPEDWSAVQSLGDLRAREGNRRGALELYRRLAEHYEEDDHLPRAIAVWRLVLRHDPEFVGTHVKLAELYGRQGFRAESVRHYEAAVAGFETQRRPHEAALARRALGATQDEAAKDRAKTPPTAQEATADAPVAAETREDAAEPAEDQDLESLKFTLVEDEASFPEAPDASGEILAPAQPAASGEPPTESEGLVLSGLFDDIVAAVERPSLPDRPGGQTAGDVPVSDVLPLFQQHVDAQIALEDYQARYDLGIAYREMGLIDEALAEFQLAARDPGQLVDCVSLMAGCFLEKGLPELAVRWLERGLAARECTEDGRHALRYELGHALEVAGQTERALETFILLYGEAAGYRDVAARVERLRGVPSQTGVTRNVTGGE